MTNRFKQNRRTKKRLDEQPGALWENEIRGVNKLLKGRGLANVVKMPDPVRIESRNQATGKITGRTVTRKHVDFLGEIDGGRSVAFDAKSVDGGTSWSLAKKYLDQWQFLTTKARFGAVAFFYVQLRERFRKRRFVFPVDADGLVAGVASRKDGYRKSVNYEQHAAPFEVGQGDHWLHTVIGLIADGWFAIPGDRSPKEGISEKVLTLVTR